MRATLPAAAIVAAIGISACGSSKPTFAIPTPGPGGHTAFAAVTGTGDSDLGSHTLSGNLAFTMSCTGGGKASLVTVPKAASFAIACVKHGLSGLGATRVNITPAASVQIAVDAPSTVKWRVVVYAFGTHKPTLAVGPS